MMGACNITGFLPECCKLHMRSGTQASKTSEGASGTVDQEEFALWIEHFIVPVVGRIKFKEPHSIVVLDNASVHFPPRVIRDIGDRSAKVGDTRAVVRVQRATTKRCFGVMGRRSPDDGDGW